MAKYGGYSGGIKTQDYMPENDFNPDEPIPMPEPLPGEEEPLQVGEMQQSNWNEAPAEQTSATMPDSAAPDEPEAMDNSLEEQAEAPAAPSLPSSLPTGSYALPGSLGARPYQSANLRNAGAGDEFSSMQGFGGPEVSPEDEDLLNNIVRSLGRK